MQHDHVLKKETFDLLTPFLGSDGEGVGWGGLQAKIATRYPHS